MYNAIMDTTDILLAVVTVLLPVVLFLYAGYKQRPRLPYILAYALGIIAMVYLINNQPKALNTNIGAQYGSSWFPLWVDVTILVVVVLAPLTVAFLLARWVGAKRGQVPMPRGLGKLDLWRLGIVALIAAAFLPLVGLRNQLEQSIPNPDHYVKLELPLIPWALFSTSYTALSPATDQEISAAESRLGVVFPPELRAMYRVSNGGGYAWLYVPTVEDPRKFLVDWRPIGARTGGAWIPVQELGYATRFAALNKPNSQTGAGYTFPPESENWIVLSANLPHLIFLEKQAGSLRLGLADLSKAPSALNPQFFPSFGRFLAHARLRAN